MKNLTWKKLGLLGVILAGAFCLSGSVAAAGPFVSFNGKFHFTYPDTWAQIDYQTAEYYLTRGNPDDDVEFEGVFSERETFVLFQDQYLILTVDTVGELSPQQIDSVLNDLTAEFDRPVKECSSEEFMTAPNRDSILFDRANYLVAIESEVAGDDSGPRISLLVMKFYSHGVANFYYYVPVFEYMTALPVFKTMVNSFSDQDLEAAMSSDEPVKVADLDRKGDSGKLIWMFAGFAAILIIILATRIRSRRRKS